MYHDVGRTAPDDAILVNNTETGICGLCNNVCIISEYVAHSLAAWDNNHMRNTVKSVVTSLYLPAASSTSYRGRYVVTIYEMCVSYIAPSVMHKL